jgi:hypothetical protein
VLTVFRVRFETLNVETTSGARHVLAVIPSGTIHYGRERLQSLHQQQWWTPVDHAIIHAVRSDPRPVHAVILSGDGPGPDDRWCFAEDLDAEAAAQLAAMLLRTHAMMCKELAPQGVFSLFVTSLGPHEHAAYQRGTTIATEQLESEMQHADPSMRPALRLDQWLVERQTTASACPLREFIDDRLATLLSRGERQFRQLRRVVGRLVTRPS